MPTTIAGVLNYCSAFPDIDKLSDYAGKQVLACHWHVMSPETTCGRPVPIPDERERLTALVPPENSVVIAVAGLMTTVQHALRG
jgi:hypothetical protein